MAKRSTIEAGTDELVIHYPAELNEHGYGLLWFASWIVDGQGTEGDWFYSGRGGESRSEAIPRDAIGVRIRRWPSEGLDAEYSDILFADGAREVQAAELDFDRKQRFSRLPADPQHAIRGIDPQPD